MTVNLSIVLFAVSGLLATAGAITYLAYKRLYNGQYEEFQRDLHVLKGLSIELAAVGFLLELLF